MKSIKTAILFTAAMLVPVLAGINGSVCQAQMDNVVDIENSYRPEVKDASKINVLPDIEPTTTRHYNVQYSLSPLPTSTYSFQPAWAAGSDAVEAGAPRGFATLAGGTRGNVLARGAYGLKFSDDDLLNFDLSLRGHNGYVGSDFYDPYRERARFYTTRGSIGYEHKFDHQSSLLIDADVESQVFNYSYDKQHNYLGDFTAAVTPYQFSRFSLGGAVGFSLFNQEHLQPHYSADEKAGETHLFTRANAGYDLSDESSVKLDVAANTFSYNLRSFDNYTSFDVNPHFDYNNGKLRLRAGLHLNLASGFGAKTRLAPDVRLGYLAGKTTDLFVALEGGEVFNDYRRFAQMSPYWMHAYPFIPFEVVVPQQLPQQFDRLRASAGVNWHFAEGWFTKLYGGIDLSRNRAELYDMGNFLAAADGTHFYAGARFHYDGLQQRFHADADTRFHSWKTDGLPGDNASHILEWRPNTELDAKADYDVVPRVNVGIDFLLRTYSDKDTQVIKMPTAANVGLSATYQVPVRSLRPGQHLSLYVRGDNLFNCHYNEYLGYRAQGRSVLVGAAVTF